MRRIFILLVFLLSFAIVDGASAQTDEASQTNDSSETSDAQETAAQEDDEEPDC